MKKITLLGLTLASVTGIAVVAAAGQTNSLFRTTASFEPYNCVYNNSVAKITIDSSDSTVGTAKSREVNVGFSGFTFSDDSYASFVSGADVSAIGTSSFDHLNYACFWNIEPIHGVIGGNITTHALYEEDGITEKKFTVLAVYSDSPMSNVNDPIKTARNVYPSYPSYVVINVLYTDLNYGFAAATNLSGSQGCSIMPKDSETPLQIPIGEGTNPGTGNTAKIYRQIGSFKYFFYAFYGDVAIDELSFYYTCTEASSDYTYIDK